MKTYKAAHINLAFTGLVVCIASVLVLLIWQRQDAIELALGVRERQAAREEILEAISSLDQETTRIAKDLSEWDETRQQLVHDGYYTVWRDIRLKESGKLSAGVDGVGLYDKAGQILLADTGPDPMPSAIAPAQAGLPVFVDMAGHAHILMITPVYADPAHTVLLGYLAIKTDLFPALAGLRHFRFVDPDTLAVTFRNLEATDYRTLAHQIRYDIRPNPYLELFREVFKTTLLQLLVLIVAILSGAALLMHRTMVRPLQGLSSEIDAMRHHSAQQTAKSSMFPIQELENVRNSFHNYHARLMALHTDLEKNAHEFQYQAVHDALTGTLNRRAFDNDGQKTGRCALLLIDCDRFKSINDLHGHAVGDKVIKAIAACLQDALRTEDKLYRLGGDEFAALLNDTDRDGARAIADRCRLLIQAHDFSGQGLMEPISLSIGIALNDNLGIDMETMQRQADIAMYAAKQPDSEKIVFYDDLPAWISSGEKSALTGSDP
jgi:diguanylate cyclase (GGDEF)-like protein